ncbi:TetR family transcriptional regulator [Alkaliphilus crotonatoxidans]
MPKQTFFNLPELKQSVLIEAAKKEFSRAPLHEACISNIIRYAEISRGSFYQYFNDKEDLFFFVLNDFVKDIHHQLLVNLKDQKGDLLAAFIETYIYLYQCFIENENRFFLKNAFLNMNHKIQCAFFPNSMKESKEILNELVDWSRLSITTNQELIYVMRIMMVVTVHNVIHSFTQEKTMDEALKIYMVELNLIARGICKEEVINASGG